MNKVQQKRFDELQKDSKVPNDIKKLMNSCIGLMAQIKDEEKWSDRKFANYLKKTLKGKYIPVAKFISHVVTGSPKLKKLTSKTK